MTATSATGFSMAGDEGEALWFLDTLMTVKAGAEQTGGSFTLLDCLLAPGFGPPPHLHEREDEAFYLLEGRVTVRCGDASYALAPGGFVYLPRGIVHSFGVDAAAPARMLQLTLPAGFERFARELGQPTASRSLPPPAAPDVERLVSVAARHGYRIMRPSAGH